MAALVEKERQLKLKKIRNIDTDLRLVQWLDMHKTDPYPTKLEKKWLACDSGKTIGQIEGWFSNAAVHKITTYCEKGEGPSLLGRNWLSAINWTCNRSSKWRSIVHFKVFSVVSVRFLRRSLALYKG